MTKEEFIYKWCPRDEEPCGMEFDLISVIKDAEVEGKIKMMENHLFKHTRGE